MLPFSTLNVYVDTDGACRDVPGPCGRSECRYNLRGERVLERANEQDGDLRSTIDPCVLALAEDGPMVLEDIGKALGVTRERARQLEVQALRRLRDGIEKIGLRMWDVRDILRSRDRAA